MKLILIARNLIIAPHGITDIGHSILTKNTNSLFKIYGSNFLVTNIISKHKYSYQIMNVLLFVSTVIHFRHDIPKITFNNIFIPRYIFIILLLGFTINYPNYLIYYMVLFHVPNHFKLNNFHIKKMKFFNILLYFLFGLLSFTLSNRINFDNILLKNYIISIIFSHVLYQEKYVIK